MKILKNTNELDSEVELRDGDKQIGFVPTLGALHEGHMSLIKRALEENDFVIASIFVNPTQFDNKEDLEKYPRTLEADIAMLEDQGCHFLFLPGSKDVYPSGTELKQKYDIGYLEALLEGESRPGHYQGVCQVVHRLLDMVKPSKLYLGQKDYQQVMIISKMIADYDLPVEVVVCDIIREEDGLAMSSRNRRLSERERQSAKLLSQTLFACKKNIENYSLMELQKWAVANINASEIMKVDYLSFHNAKTLMPIEKKEDAEHIVVLSAVFLGPVRLIDNVIIS